MSGSIPSTSYSWTSMSHWAFLDLMERMDPADFAHKVMLMGSKPRVRVRAEPPKDEDVI